MRKGVMRCDCPGCWDCRERNGKRPPGRRENASDCWGKNGVKDHWNGQGNLAVLGLIPGEEERGTKPPGPGGRPGGHRAPATPIQGRASQPCPLQSAELSPSSALPAQPREAEANQNMMGKQSLGVSQVFGGGKSPRIPLPVQGPRPQAMLCASREERVLRAADSHSRRFSKGYAKVSTQLTCPEQHQLCLPHFQTWRPPGSSAAPPAHLHRPLSPGAHSQHRGDGRDEDNNSDASISSTLGVFKSSHLRNEPIPAFFDDLLGRLSDGQMVGLCSHITSWSTRHAGTPALLCVKVTESQNGLG